MATPLLESLELQQRAWVERPLVRRLYTGWHELIASRLSALRPTVELGSGAGHLRDVVPGLVTTDIEPTPWADEVVDAETMPYEDGSVGNLVLFDVFHHLPAPARFLDEAVRVLAPGGRIVVFDPYCSPVSTLAYRFAHHERTDLRADPFAADEAVGIAPLDSNQARATLALFRHDSELASRWPGLRIVERRRLALLVYPLSGGLTGRRLLPRSLWAPAAALERGLAPLDRLLAFRCLVVLERAG